MRKEFRLFVLSTVILYTAVFLFGNGAVSFGQGDNIEELKEKIKKLQERVEELESQQENDSRTSALPGIRNRTWDPFEEMARMQEEMDRMFENSFSLRGNNTNGLFGSSLFYDNDFGFEEKKDKYIIKFDISGLDQDKIEINVKDQYISLKCESGSENNSQDKNGNYYSKSYSTFYKSFPLPEDADTLSMKTEKKDDKLFIILPKKDISTKTTSK